MLNTTLEGKRNRTAVIMEELSLQQTANTLFQKETLHTAEGCNIAWAIRMGLLPDRRKTVQPERVVFVRLK